MRRRAGFVAIFAAALPAPAIGAAPDPDGRFWIRGAAFYPVVDTDVRVDDLRVNAVGTNIDFERDLDFDTREALPSVSAGMALGRNWRIVADFYRVSRRRTASLDEDVEFDGVLYPAGTSARGGFRSDILRLSVGRALVKRPSFELGASLGAHVTSFTVSLAGATSPAPSTPAPARRRREVLAPLPTLGLYAEWGLAPKLDLSARVDALRLELGDFDGRLINAEASLAYRLSRGISAGLLWRHVRYRLDVEKTDWSGRLRYGFSGPGAFLQARF